MKPQLDVRTMYGFLQVNSLAAVLEWFGQTLLTFRYWALSVKLLVIPIVVVGLAGAGVSSSTIALAVISAIAFATSLFTMVHFDPLRSGLPLLAVLTIMRGSAADRTVPGPWIGITAGVATGLSFFWSPEYAVAGAVCTLLYAVVSGRTSQVAPWVMGTSLVIGAVVPWSGRRSLELIYNHVEFIFERAGGYGATPIPPGGVAYVLVPAAGVAMAVLHALRPWRDPRVVALGAYVIATAFPAIVRADSLHLDQAAFPLMAMLAVVLSSRHSSFQLAGFGVVLGLCLSHASLTREPSVLDVGARWDLQTYKSEVREGVRRPAKEPRLRGMLLDIRETEFYEGTTQMLRCASEENEKIFILSNSLVFYFLADRLPATRFPLFFIRHTPAQQTALVAELDAAAPRIVLLSDAVGIDRHATQTHPYLYNYLSKHYESLQMLSSRPIPGLKLQEVRLRLLERRDSFLAGVGTWRLTQCR